jgi:hypothetical protein
MLHRITLATAVLLSITTTPGFSDDEIVDCFYEANAGNPACSRNTELSETATHAIDPANSTITAASTGPANAGGQVADRKTPTPQ